MFGIDDQLTELRHALHREPEIGLDLPLTQRKVLDALDGLPLEITTGKALSSVTAVLRGGRPGPAVLLRGDMDALPVQEETALPYTSKIDGAMHACGHDIHTAALVGAARLLSGRRETLSGDVIFMFQPGEEGCAGARLMLEEGVLEAAGKPVIGAYALHVSPTVLPVGHAASRAGTLMAASDQIRVVVTGRGGHGSSPHMAKDPVQALCAIVGELQTAITREIDIFDPAVLTVGQLQAGTASNVIPETAEFAGTVRTFSEGAHQKIQEVVERVVRGVALAHGVSADLDYRVGYPVTVNDAEETAFAMEVARDVVEHVHEAPTPLAGAEDFSFVLQRVPGSYLLIGACPPEADAASAPANHSARAVHDDRVLPIAARLLADLAERRLSRAAQLNPPGSTR